MVGLYNDWGAKYKEHKDYSSYIFHVVYNNHLYKDTKYT